jgi:Flp pilus assembly CpaF family ATPase
VTVVLGSDVIRQLADAVAARLAEIEGGGRNGPSGDPVAREALAAKLINDALDTYARERITTGQEPLGAEAEDELAARVRSQLFGLAELERLVSDDSVENVLCNGWDAIWRRHADGSRERVEPVTDGDAALTELIRQAAATQGRTERRFDVGQPWVSFRLSDGSRMTAVREVSGRTVFALRRHRHSDVDIAELLRLGTVSELVASLLTAAVRSRRNLLVVGGTDAGKTT